MRSSFVNTHGLNIVYQISKKIIRRCTICQQNAPMRYNQKPTLYVFACAPCVQLINIKSFFDSLSEDWWLLDEKVEVVFTADLPVTMMHRAFEAPRPLSSHLKTK